MKTCRLVTIVGVMILTASPARAFNGTHRGFVAGLGSGGMMMYSDEPGETDDLRVPVHATIGFGFSERFVLTGDLFITDFEEVCSGFFQCSDVSVRPTRVYAGYTASYFPGGTKRSLMVGWGIGWYKAQAYGPQRTGIHVMLGYELWHLQMGLLAPCLITNVHGRPQDAPRFLPGFFVRMLAF